MALIQTTTPLSPWGEKEGEDHATINPEVFGQEPPLVPNDHYGGNKHAGATSY